jgi:hypothetical protein
MLGSLSSVNSSWQIPSIAPTLPPDTPTGFSVSTSASYATLTFTPPAGATSYTATATPTTNTHEIAVVRTFSSGSGYKLEVLSSQTTYTFSLVAANSSGTSAATTVSATTLTATIQASPTITLTSLATFDISAQNPTSYNHIASPKTLPNYIYSSFHNIGTYSPRMPLFYSDNGGTSFTNIATRLKWNGNDSSTTADTICADVACSDDGKYVYVQPFYRWLNVSTDSGATFNFSKSTSVNSSAAIALSTIPTGEAVILAGQGSGTYGTTNFAMHWSNNYNSTYAFRDVSAGNNAAAINPATNYVYYSTGSTNNILAYYNAGTKSNLLSFNFNTATFSTLTMGTICGIISRGNLTFVACTAVPKLRKSTNGFTFTNVAAFNTGGIAAGATLSAGAWMVMEPYVGFILVCTRNNPAQIYYSKDSGSTWAQLTSPTIPTITGASAGTCVLQDSNVVVTIMVTNVISGVNYRVSYYKLSIPVDIV